MERVQRTCSSESQASRGRRWRTTAHLLAAVLAGIALSGSTGAAAQVTGTVVDAAGRPVSAASVELWGGGERIARTVTDSAGAFSVDRARSSGVRTLAVHRIGFRRAVVAVAEGAVGVRVRLEADAVALEGVAAAAPRRVCPNRDDPVVRGLWESARRRYATDTRRHPIAFALFSSDRTLPAERLSEVDDERGVPATEAYEPLFFEIRDTALTRGPYAFALAWRTPGAGPREFLAWEYIPFHGAYSSLFADETFGRQHTFSLHVRVGRETTLAFCPRGGDRTVQGTLTVGADTTFVAATWRFQTPRPREDAGGELTFLPFEPGEDGSPPDLLPARSVFWRKQMGRDVYFHRSMIYTRWRVRRSDARAEERPVKAKTGRDADAVPDASGRTTTSPRR